MTAILGALWSLRGAPSMVVSPTESVHYRAHALPGIAPLADVYLPPHPTGASVVLVHGGAFVIGSRQMKPVRYLAARLFASGIAVCAIDYRMIFRGGRLDEAVDDTCAAVEFWRGRAPDPRAISLVGLSAGGSIAMLAAARTAGLHRLACAFGLYELDAMRGVANLVPRLLFRTPDRATWRDRSPRQMPQPSVATLLLHGDADGLVPVDQAHRLAAHRAALGLPTSLVVYPGAPHGFFSTTSAVADAGAREIIDHVQV